MRAWAFRCHLTCEGNRSLYFSSAVGQGFRAAGTISKGKSFARWLETDSATVAVLTRRSDDQKWAVLVCLCLAGGLHFGEQFDKFLLALGLVVAALSVRELSNVHGAEFWPAHGAELRFLVKIVG